MLTPLSEGGMGMTSHELTEWGVYFQLEAADRQLENGGGSGNSTEFETPRVLGT